MPNLRAWTMLGLGLLTTGCMAHVPVAATDSLTKQNVRLHLSQSGRERLFGMLDRGGRFVDAQVLRQDRDSFLVEVNIPRAEGFEQDGVLVQQIPVARGEVIALEVRRVDRFRTLMLVGLIGAAATALVIRTFSGEAGGGAFPPMDNGQTESVVPGFQWFTAPDEGSQAKPCPC